MPRFYTVKEANDLLPELSRLLRIMQQEEQQLAIVRDRNASLKQKTHGNGWHNPTEDSALVRAMKRSEEAMQTAAKLLVTWEIEVKDVQRGLVDFPALHDGRTVLLCWQLGEPEVAYWHETTSGFAGRQPLDASFD